MATHHAKPNEVVDLMKWADDLPLEKSKAIIKTGEAELARLVLRAGEEFRDHKVSGPITVQCLKGAFYFTAMGTTQKITEGELLYLGSSESHSLKADLDSIILLTIIFVSE